MINQMDYSSGQNNNGLWKYTNHLVNSVNPYLKRYAHDPVNWYSLCKEAIIKAKIENKPILLMIGYASCVWSQRMQQEIFQDPNIATLINKHFVAINLDKDENPDIDEIYMYARQFLTGESGWPNITFLDSDFKAFLTAGAFLKSQPLGVGFKEIALKVVNWWMNKPDEVEATGQYTKKAIEKLVGKFDFHPANDLFLDRTILGKYFKQISLNYDVAYSGFFGAPKFLNGSYLLSLLTIADPGHSKFALNTLDNIAAGGIHDLVSGGFWRYSFDSAWLMPHFEMTLTDQALMILSYLKAYELTKDDFYRHITVKTLNLIQKQFTGKLGQFYNALSSPIDTNGENHYLWHKEEVFNLFSPAEQNKFDEYFQFVSMMSQVNYQFTEQFLIAGKNVEAIKKYYTEYQDILSILAGVRKNKPQAIVDSNVITAYHSMMIYSFVKSYQILGDKIYLDQAIKAAQYIINQAIDQDGNLYRIGGINKKSVAYLDCYAYTIQALLALLQVTNDPKWLETAKNLLDKCNQLFWDYNLGGYFTNQDFSAEMMNLAKFKTIHDSNFPSGNYIMIKNLELLANIENNTRWAMQAEQIMKFFAPLIYRKPLLYPMMMTLIKN